MHTTQPITTPAELRERADAFTKAYVEAMFWSSTAGDDDGTPLDRDYDIEDLAPETIARIVADCAKFQAENASLLVNGACERPSDISVAAGHDFWLTRAGHGAGFWDGDWEEPAASELTRACEAFGELDLYVGGDGKLYF